MNNRKHSSFWITGMWMLQGKHNRVVELREKARRWFVGENDTLSTAQEKKKGNMKRLWGWGFGWRQQCMWGGGGVGRRYMCQVWCRVTVELAPIWPLPLWRQRRGNRADGWLACVSAPLWSTTGVLCPFVSIKNEGWGGSFRCRTLSPSPPAVVASRRFQCFWSIFIFCRVLCSVETSSPPEWDTLLRV